MFNIQNKYILGALAIICSIASAMFLQDATLGVIFIPLGLYLIFVPKKKWDEINKRG